MHFRCHLQRLYIKTDVLPSLRRVKGKLNFNLYKKEFQFVSHVIPASDSSIPNPHKFGINNKFIHLMTKVVEQKNSNIENRIHIFLILMCRNYGFNN